MDGATLIYIIGAIFGIFGFYVFGNFKQSERIARIAKRNTVGTVAILVGAFLILGQVGALSGLGVAPFFAGGTTQPEQPSDGTDDTDNGQDVSGACSAGNQIEDTTLQIQGIDQDTGSATGGNHEYRVNDGTTNSISDGGTDTVSPGDQVDVLWMGGNSSSDYLGDVTSTTVPCQGTFNLNKQLYKNGSVDLKVYDSSNDDLADGSTANQSIAQDGVYSLRTTLTGSSGTGDPHGGVVVVEYNSSIYDGAEVGGFGISNPENTPSSRFYQISDTDNAFVGYDVPRIVGSSGTSEGKKEGSIELDVRDSSSMTIDSNTSNVDVTYYPKNFYLDSESGSTYQGPAVEDESGAATYQDSSQFTINVDQA